MSSSLNNEAFHKINSKLRHAPDYVSNTFTDNHCRYVSVSPDAVRHDRCVSNSERLKAMDTPFIIDNRLDI